MDARLQKDIAGEVVIMNHNKSVHTIASSLFFCFSAFFLANITKLSPIYFSFLGTLFLCAFLLFTVLRIRLPVMQIHLIQQTVLLICTIVFQMFFTRIGDFIVDYCIYIISFFYLVLGLLILNHSSCNSLKKAINGYFFISSLVLFFDLLNRLLRRDNSYSGLLYFYNFKLNGIMFQDSNFSGFLGMVNFSFALYLNDKKISRFSRRQFIVLFILMLVNLSRAAILGSIVAMMWSWYSKLGKKTKYYLTFFLIGAALAIIPVLYDFFTSDDSFNTKIEIFTRTKSYLHNADISQLLFGNGIFSSPEYIGRSGHNYISQTIIELGLVVFLEEMFLFVCMTLASYGGCLYIVLPYLVVGLSCAPMMIPYFYAIGAMIIILENVNKRGDRNGFNQRDNAGLQCRAVCCRGNRIDFKSIIFKYRICDC